MAKIIQPEQRQMKTLEGINAFEHACQQYVNKEDWGAMSEYIVGQANQFVDKENLQVLNQWISTLPKPTIEENIWLMYWQGASIRFDDHHNAMKQLEVVFNKFKNDANIKGQFMTWLMIVESIALAFDDLTPLKHWIKEYDLLKARHPHCPGFELKLKVYALAAGVMSMVQPTHPRLKKLITICQLGGPLIPFKEPRAAILAYLAFHYLSSGQIAHLNALSRHLVPALTDATLPVQIRLLSHAMMGLQRIIIGKKELYKVLDSGLEIATYGEAFYSTVQAYRIYADAMGLNLEQAKKQLKVFLKHIPSEQRMDVSHHDFMLSWVTTLEGNYVMALEQSKLAKALAKTLGFDFGVALNSNLCAQLYVLQDDFTAAEIELNELWQLAENNNSQLVRVMYQFANAWYQLKKYDPAQALPEIQKAFKAAKAEGILAYPGLIHSVIGELALVAIMHKCSNVFIVKMIRRWNLIPFSSIQLYNDWPWSVKVQTFGDFTVEVDGQPIDQKNRLHRRSIELLKTLVSLGATQVSKVKLSQILWPDSEGDKAIHALENLLHRTRKLVGNDTLISNGGKIDLNTERCWLDTWALQSVKEHLINQEKCLQTKKYLLDLYQGEFLTDFENSSVLNEREKQRRQFINQVALVGEQLASSKQHDELTDLWQQAIEREPYHEALYFSLAQHYIGLGSYSEAKQTFQRCQKIIQATYGTSPSIDFQKFAEQESL